MTREELEKLGLSEEQVNIISESLQEYIKKEDYEKQIISLQEENKNKEEQYKKEFNDFKINNAIELSISKAKGKNSKAIRALIDLDSISINEEGLVKGIDNQIENLVKDLNSSFLFGEKIAEVKGSSPKISQVQVTNGITKDQFEKMSYKERLDLYTNNKELHDSLSDTTITE